MKFSGHYLPLHMRIEFLHAYMLASNMYPFNHMVGTNFTEVIIDNIHSAAWGESSERESYFNSCLKHFPLCFTSQ